MSQPIHWTPVERNAFIQSAINSTDKHGVKGPYHFSVMPKMETGLDFEDVRRSQLTEVMAQTLYMPEHKKIVFGFYRTLCEKLIYHPVIASFYNKDVIVLLKGSNAQKYLVQAMGLPDPDNLFKHSDTDLMVCVNPFLERTLFAKIKEQVEIAIKQALSQFKRCLDHFLFLHKPFECDFMNSDTIESFKKAFALGLSNINVEQAVMLSPFDSDNVRNACSRNSFFITNSKVKEDSVVKIDVPHYEWCERIPLRKTPLFCSFNETIDFKRDGMEKMGKFNLYRLRMNVICQHIDEDGEIERDEKLPVEFIDVSVPDQHDEELMSFWTTGCCMNVFDHDAGYWITIPDIRTVYSELDRILNEYESCDAKKEKREKKLAFFKRVITN